MTVSIILAGKGREVVTIEPNASLTEAVALLAEKRIGALLILGADRRIVGILSERDIVRALAERGAGQAQEFVPQLAGFEHSALGAVLEAAPIGERHRHRARHAAMLDFRPGHQLDAMAESTDLRVGQCRLVPGFGIARLAAERQRDRERDAVLRQHQIGRLRNVVALDHPRGAGDADGLDLGAGKAVFGLQVAHGFDRGMRGGVARIALQHRGRDDELLAEAARQLGCIPFCAENFEKPEFAFEHGARSGETAGGEARRQHPRFRCPPQMQALDHAAVAAGEFQ